MLTPEISYSFYPVYSQNYNVKMELVPLKEDFSFDPDEFCKRKNSGIAIANPNAPTSIAISLEEVEKIVKSNPDSVVIIDEAYIAFSGKKVESAVSLINKYPNLVVVQTTSKEYSLAGLRVGWAIADEELIEGLLRNRDSFNSYPVDRLAQVIAAAAVNDGSYYDKRRLQVIEVRDNFIRDIKELGFEVCDSSANFVFTKPSKISAKELYEYLKSKKIYVRYWDKPKISEYLRITVGTKEEMSKLLSTIKEVIN